MIGEIVGLAAEEEYEAGAAKAEGAMPSSAAFSEVEVRLRLSRLGERASLARSSCEAERAMSPLLPDTDRID